MEEITLWNLLASGRIGNALGVIALILFGWLALRYANAVRESGDATMAHKVLGSIFVLSGGFAGYNWSIESQNWYIGTANALSSLKASGTEISSGAEGFIAQYGTDYATSADPVALIFWIVVIATALMSLWMPKNA